MFKVFLKSKAVSASSGASDGSQRR